jgi:hypothetical protein
MGRHKKYFTEEEKHNANKAKYMRYYWKNAKKIRKKNLKRYYDNNGKSQM